MEYQLDWLIDEAKEKGGEMPKTIIFCNTLKDIASVVNLLFVKLGKYAFVPVGSTKCEKIYYWHFPFSELAQEEGKTFDRISITK